MESYWAKIRGNTVMHVEVVSDAFVAAHPNRYSGKWLKVGNGSARPFTSMGAYYIASRDMIIVQRPYVSWHLVPAQAEWNAPVPKPGPDWMWDEPELKWVPKNGKP